MKDKETGLETWKANATNCHKLGCEGFWNYDVCIEIHAQKQCRLEEETKDVFDIDKHEWKGDEI